MYEGFSYAIPTYTEVLVVQREGNPFFNKTTQQTFAGLEGVLKTS